MVDLEGFAWAWSLSALDMYSWPVSGCSTGHSSAYNVVVRDAGLDLGLYRIARVVIDGSEFWAYNSGVATSGMSVSGGGPGLAWDATRIAFLPSIRHGSTSTVVYEIEVLVHNELDSVITPNLSVTWQ